MTAEVQPEPSMTEETAKSIRVEALLVYIWNPLCLKLMLPPVPCALVLRNALVPGMPVR